MGRLGFNGANVIAREARPKQSPNYEAFKTKRTVMMPVPKNFGEPVEAGLRSEKQSELIEHRCRRPKPMTEDNNTDCCLEDEHACPTESFRREF